MAPLKFEESIKTKLEERTIQPSKGSWAKLADQLDDEKEEKSSSKNKWLFAAASVIGLVILTSVFLSSGEGNKFEQHQIVDNTKEIDDIPGKNEIVIAVENELISDSVKNLDASKEVVVNKIKTNDEVLNNRNDITKKSSTYKSVVVNTKERNEDDHLKDEVVIRNALAVSKVETKELDQKENNFSIREDVIKDKLDLVLAQVQELEEGQETVTDDDINDLLYKAQKEILTQELLNSNTVNASALLLDVEIELDESFKQRVFDALKAGFQKIKTSVAERDN